MPSRSAQTETNLCLGQRLAHSISLYRTVYKRGTAVLRMGSIDVQNFHRQRQRTFPLKWKKLFVAKLFQKYLKIQFSIEYFQKFFQQFVCFVQRTKN